MRPASYCPKELEKRLLATSGVERVSIISLGDMSTRMDRRDRRRQDGHCRLHSQEFPARMPGVFSLKGDTLKVPGGLAFLSQDTEARQVVSISRDGDLMAAILGNPAMIDAYLAGVLGNGVDVRQPDDLTPDIEQRKGLGGDTIAHGCRATRRARRHTRLAARPTPRPCRTNAELHPSIDFALLAVERHCDSHRSPLTLCS